MTKRLSLFVIIALAAGGVAVAPDLVGGCLWNCAADGASAQTVAVPPVTVRPVDETGRPLGAPQTVSLSNGPAMTVAQAPGHIAEPVVLGLEDAGKTIDVRLLSDDNGKRFVVNAAGDVMFGRRYQSDSLIPAGDAATGAKAVVDAVAPAFRLADLSTVNPETVVSSAAASQAYPKKRFILESPPASVDGLKELGGATPLIRLTPYHFDDTDPTEDPDSTPLRDVNEPVAVPADGQWHEVSIDVSAKDLGRAGNMVLLRLGLAASRAGSVAGQAVDFDDVSFVEWRPADAVPNESGAYDFVRDTGAAPVALTFNGYAY